MRKHKKTTPFMVFSSFVLFGFLAWAELYPAMVNPPAPASSPTALSPSAPGTEANPDPASLGDFSDIKGYIEYISSPFGCWEAHCLPETHLEWRQTQTEVFVDGQTIITQSIDLIEFESAPRSNPSPSGSPRSQNPSQAPSKVERLKFSAGESTRDAGGGNVGVGTGVLSYSFNNPSLAAEFTQQVLPKVAVGLANGIADAQRSANISRQLHGAFQRYEAQNLQAIASSQQQRLSLNQQQRFTMALSAARMGQMTNLLPSESTGQAGLERAKKLQAFEKQKKDPLAVKQYELTEKQRDEAIDSFLDSVFDGELRKAVEIAEVLLNQKDPQAISFAEKAVIGTIKDGILVLDSATNGRLNGPLDHYSPTTKLGTPFGELVRRVANEAQLSWYENQGFQYATEEKRAQFVAASLLLARADDLILVDKVLGLVTLEASRTLFKAAVGTLVGASQSVMEMVQSIPEAYHFAKKAYDGAKETYESVIHNSGSVSEEANNLAYQSSLWLTRQLVSVMIQPTLTKERAYDIIIQSPQMIQKLLANSWSENYKIFEISAYKSGQTVGQISADFVVGAITSEITGGVATVAKSSKVAAALNRSKTAIKGLINTEDLMAGLQRNSKFIANATRPLTPERTTYVKKIAQKSPEAAETVLKGLGIGEAAATKDTINPMRDFMGKLVDTQSPILTQVDELRRVEALYNQTGKIPPILEREALQNLGVYPPPSYRVVERYSPIHRDPGPLDLLKSGDMFVADTFRGGSYMKTILEEDTILYRVHKEKDLWAGGYWSRTRPLGRTQVTLDAALDPSWGNTPNYVTAIKVPKGTELLEGVTGEIKMKKVLPSGKVVEVGALPGGSSQVYFPQVHGVRGVKERNEIFNKIMNLNAENKHSILTEPLPF